VTRLADLCSSNQPRKLVYSGQLLSKQDRIQCPAEFEIGTRSQTERLFEFARKMRFLFESRFKRGRFHTPKLREILNRADQPLLLEPFKLINQWP
jgi:hypothetical protein